MSLTEKQIKQNDHIPTGEIVRDVEITQREIDQYQKEVDAMMSNPQENRLAIYMREAKITKRKTFVSNLNSILEYREALSEKPNEK